LEYHKTDIYDPIPSDFSIAAHGGFYNFLILSAVVTP
jgi:hypothetical protein